VFSVAKLAQIESHLHSIAPLALAEDWDNVGLLSGNPQSKVDRIMTCLTLSAVTVAESIAEQADLVITHHPLPFRPVNRIVTSTTTGKYLWELTRAGVAIYSPHTAWDNAKQGINAQLAQIVGLEDVNPMKPTRLTSVELSGLGTGRVGSFPTDASVDSIIERLKSTLTHLRFSCNHPLVTRCRRMAIVCGSGGSFVDLALSCGADLLLTGEATYHQFLEAQSQGLVLLTMGHFASERFAMNQLAAMLQTDFPELTIWASRQELDSGFEVSG
jgi:GTP cyclohydrolase I